MMTFCIVKIIYENEANWIFLQATVILDTFSIPKTNINELTIIIFGVMKTDFIN